MKLLLGLALAVLCCVVSSMHSPPVVQVYSRNPGEFGTDNTIICHVSNFHPPDIEISILKNGVEIPNSKQTDLAFRKDWRFHLTKNVAFTPQKGDEYTCKVTHGGHSSKYFWEPNM